MKIEDLNKEIEKQQLNESFPHDFQNMGENYTGIPGYIRITTTTNAQPLVTYRLRLSPNAPIFTISIEAEPKIIFSSLPPDVVQKMSPIVIAWVKQNLSLLLKYWNQGASWYTDDTDRELAQLKKIQGFQNTLSEYKIQIAPLLEEMSNLRMTKTGVPGAFFISVKEACPDNHIPRIKYYLGDPPNCPNFSIAICAAPYVLGGKLPKNFDAKLFKKIKKFIIRNKEKLLTFWYDGAEWDRPEVIAFPNTLKRYDSPPDAETIT
jgi:hypothetical protein